MKNLLCVVAALCLGAIATVPAQVPSGQAPPGQSEYVPIDQLPPQDQLPAAPLLIAAYAFVWVGVFGYLWSLMRRLKTVQAEIEHLEHRLPNAKA
jgi:CcmD family protein